MFMARPVRQYGFYWVRIPTEDDLVVAQCLDGHKWALPGIDDFFYEGVHLEVISDRITPPVPPDGHG